jgi:hypothetical protein
MPVASPFGLVAKLFEFRVGADALNDCLRGRNERGHVEFAVGLDPNLRVVGQVGDWMATQRRHNLHRGQSIPAVGSLQILVADVGDDAERGGNRRNVGRLLERIQPVGCVVVVERTSAPGSPLRFLAPRRWLEKRSVAKFPIRLLEFLLRVHHDRAVPRHGLLEWLP